MTSQPRSTLESYFQVGDRPTSGQFTDLIDSCLNLVDTTTQSVASTVSFNSTVALNSSLTVMGASTFGSITVPTRSAGDSTTNAASTAFVATAITNAGVGTGTVSSVTFTGDGTVLSSTPSSAITSSGTLTASLKTQTANLVLIGPASGGTGSPTFRSLVTADLPATAVIAGTYSNTTLTVDTTGRITSAANGSSTSGMTLLSTVNAAGAASAVFNSTYVTSTYNTYMLVFDTVSAATNTVAIGLQVSTDNGSTWKTTNYTSSGSPTVPSGEMGIFGSNFVTNSRGMGVITFSKPSAIADQMFLINTIYNASSSPTQYNGACVWGGGVAINAIRIIADSGNITGNFHLYGLGGT